MTAETWSAIFDDLAGHRIDRRVHIELFVCDFWEQIGSFVKYGLRDEGSFAGLDPQFGRLKTLEHNHE